MENYGPETILEESKQLYEAKNDDYGDSWKLVGKIISLMLEEADEDELTIPNTPEHFIALSLYVRRLDKMIREFNGTFLKDDFEVDEDLSETTIDQVPYAAMATENAADLENL